MKGACQAAEAPMNTWSPTRTPETGVGDMCGQVGEMKTDRHSLPKAGLLLFIVLQNVVWASCVPLGMCACGKDVSSSQCLFSHFSSATGPLILS